MSRNSRERCVRFEGAKRIESHVRLSLLTLPPSFIQF